MRHARGVLPSNRLMGMCRWTLDGVAFHGWIDYNGVAFSLELLEWDRTFSGFEGSENSGRYLKMGIFLLHYVQPTCQFISG